MYFMYCSGGVCGNYVYLLASVLLLWTMVDECLPSGSNGIYILPSMHSHTNAHPLRVH